MSKRDPNDGISCETLGSDLYNAKAQLDAARAEVERLSRILGEAERARDALQAQLDGPTAGAMPDHVIRELGNQRADAAETATTATTNVQNAVAVSNEAGNEVTRQQNHFDYYCG